MTKSSCAQSENQRVVNEALFLFQDLVALLIGTRCLELHGQFVLNQNFSLDPPAGICLFPFERARRTMKGIESQHDGACFFVEATFVYC